MFESFEDMDEAACRRCGHETTMIFMFQFYPLNADFKIEHSENEMMEFFDMRNKHVEVCLDKVFAIHKIFDKEYINYPEI